MGNTASCMVRWEVMVGWEVKDQVHSSIGVRGLFLVQGIRLNCSIFENILDRLLKYSEGPCLYDTKNISLALLRDHGFASAPRPQWPALRRCSVRQC